MGSHRRIEDLEEPLLSDEEKKEEPPLGNCDVEAGVDETSSPDVIEPGLKHVGLEFEGDSGDDGDCSVCEEDGHTDARTDDSQDEVRPFCVWVEMSEMASLALPLAVSFFCRMGMASTDSAFVGHIDDGKYTAETYLAAAVLSDMCVNILMVPPLAFNQVVNALVGQAVGSGNPKMAGVWLQQSMFWLTAAMLPSLVGCFYVEPMLKLLDFPEDVSAVAGTYAKFNVFWPIPNGLYQCMRFYFQAQGLPRPAMYNNIVFLFINAALNYIFVFGGPFRWKGLGFIGAAVSLSISRTMQSFVYFVYMFLYKRHHANTWPGLSFKHHTRARTVEFLYQTVPNMGTLLFQQCTSQATTVLMGRLGERAIAASSALSTVTIPWSGTLSATTGMVSAIRVGYHLGRGDGEAARKVAWIVLCFITIANVIVAGFFLPLSDRILNISTDDKDVLSLGAVIVPAMLVGTYLNLIVGNITSGVFSGMGRPVIATILSFGLELPLSIGGVALYILRYHGDLLGVYWVQAGIGGFEALVVVLIMFASDWRKCADETRRRQESPEMAVERENLNSENQGSPEMASLIESADGDSHN
mmetsp:Transcript_7538/g.22093  ORF Transcript_7538/g.22093 Transcript_7538/m.22093 type:complete len:583 (-) Transcript_7538:157-1905(-)|eukprot:CAMPEP_0113547780 /NCGR_PEP_ID=MMETSP0015_2-20120614/12542_1 /TAXON_ID=2838 /ORGANISM="Odontella" /LENGTH=582 /DNA_ID=CAMNT_0000448365 /DNA_START=270 /DNA_END=2018 /DNA_ORIENTATION=- /assembly_acc=CAM_ASM_000160